MKKSLPLAFTALALVALVLAGMLSAISAPGSAAADIAAKETGTVTDEAEGTGTAEAAVTAEGESAASFGDFVDSSLPRYITVVGQGSSKVTPDVAILTLGAETQAPGISDAIAQNDELMSAVMLALTDAGIADEDIQTANYNVYFDEGFRGTDTLAEPVYRVSNMVTVTVRDLETVGDLLDSVIAAGANRVYGVSFTVEDWSAAESDARARSMDDARARAAELAGLAGVELGGVMSISEVVGSIPPSLYGREAALGGGGGAISPGQLEFTTSIQVTFAIR